MMADPRQIGVGLVGSGFMGRCHAFAYSAVSSLFALGCVPHRVMLADADAEAARRAADVLGFARSTGDWRVLVAEPAVGLIDIAAPNRLHHPIAMEAIRAGKPIYCEKPLAPSSADALAMTEAAEAAGITTMVGFNYLKNPIVGLAREIITSGEIGDVVSFRGIHAEGYMVDPLAPHSWRTDPDAGGGALADLGSHIIALARFLLGPVVRVSGRCQTCIPERPVAQGSSETAPVVVDDRTAALLDFASGAQGTVEASWIATGRTMQLGFEITGSRGALSFSQERMNELKLYTVGQKTGRKGFTTITAGPDHPPYGAFCPAPGHQLGFNDMKIIEIRDLMTALGGGPAAWPDFREAWRVQCIADAIMISAKEGAWAEVTSDGH